MSPPDIQVSLHILTREECLGRYSHLLIDARARLCVVPSSLYRLFLARTLHFVCSVVCRLGGKHARHDTTRLPVFIIYRFLRFVRKRSPAAAASYHNISTES